MLHRLQMQYVFLISGIVVQLEGELLHIAQKSNIADEEFRQLRSNASVSSILSNKACKENIDQELRRKASELERVNNKLELLNDWKSTFVDDQKVEMDKTKTDFFEKIKLAEKTSKLGKEYLAAQKVKDILMDKLDQLETTYGSVEDIESDVATKTQHLNQMLEQKARQDEECDITQNIIRERKGIRSRIEIENRVSENRLAATKRRLEHMLNQLKVDTRNK